MAVSYSSADTFNSLPKRISILERSPCVIRNTIGLGAIGFIGVAGPCFLQASAHIVVGYRRSPATVFNGTSTYRAPPGLPLLLKPSVRRARPLFGWLRLVTMRIRLQLGFESNHLQLKSGISVAYYLGGWRARTKLHKGPRSAPDIPKYSRFCLGNDASCSHGPCWPLRRATRSCKLEGVQLSETSIAPCLDTLKSDLV